MKIRADCVRVFVRACPRASNGAIFYNDKVGRGPFISATSVLLRVPDLPSQLLASQVFAPSSSHPHVFVLGREKERQTQYIRIHVMV